MDNPAEAVAWYYVSGINPEPWTASEASVGRKGGQRFVQFHKPAQLRAYQEALAEEFKHQNPHYVKVDGDVALYLYFWRNIGSGDNFTGRRTRANYADVTNLQKSTEDGLQHILYDNDRNIKHVVSSIIDQGSECDPGILIGIGSVDNSVAAAAVVLKSFLGTGIRSVHNTGAGSRTGEIPVRKTGADDPASAPSTDFF